MPVGDREEGGGAAPARFAARTVVGLGGVLAAGTIFALIVALLAAQWAPLRTVDSAAVDALDVAVGEREWSVTILRLVTHLGGAEAAWLLISVTTVWLLIRRLPRLAAYAAVAGIGAAVLSTGTKALVDRARPTVDAPLATAPDASFPSGHALGSTVTYGVLLFIFLPAIPPRYRRAVALAVLTLVIVVGLSRVALGVHFPSDVIGGWTLGVLWLAVTAAAFRRWREEEGLGRPPWREGLEPEDRPQLTPAPAAGSPLANGVRSVAQILVGAVVIWGALVGLGILITDVFRSAVRPVDIGIVQWFASIRSDALSTILFGAGWLGGTAGILVLLVVAVPLALAATRRWAPPLFLLVAAAGETVLFLAAATVVERDRPPVEHLSAALPPTASFPSGHVAAATVAYGGIALLVQAWTRGWIAHLVLAVAVVVPVSVALSRLYRGVHHPTDVLASFLYAGAWLAVCWWALRPGRGSACIGKGGQVHAVRRSAGGYR